MNQLKNAPSPHPKSLRELIGLRNAVVDAVRRGSTKVFYGGDETEYANMHELSALIRVLSIQIQNRMGADPSTQRQHKTNRSKRWKADYAKKVSLQNKRS